MANKGYMQTFNDDDFSTDDRDGIRMILDMKGTRCLFFKVTSHQAYDIFRKDAGNSYDNVSMRDFAVNVLFSGVEWFSMNKLHGGERTGCVSFRELPVACAGKKGIQFCFSAGGDARICGGVAYTKVTMRAVRREESPL